MSNSIAESAAKAINKRLAEDGHTRLLPIRSLTAIIADEYEPVMECLREALASRGYHHSETCVTWKGANFPKLCDCWVSRAQKLDRENL